LPGGRLAHDKTMSQMEPGLDLHEWETRWEEFQPLFEEDPAGALPEACDFIEQALVESGIVGDGIAVEEDDLVKSYEAARETADRLESGEVVDPGDVAAAIENLKAVYETLRATRAG
jgi:hypothetical protein